MRKFTLLILVMGFFYSSFAQNDHVVKIVLETDNWASETSWILFDYHGSEVATNGTLANNTVYTKEVDVPSGCYFFKLFDSYGDGIYSSPEVYGSLEIYFDDVMVGELEDPNFGLEFTMVQIGDNCPANAASFESLDMNNYQKVNTDFTVKGTIRNFGSDNITALEVGYLIDGANQVSSTLTGMDVAPGELYQFEHDTKPNLSDIGTYEFTVGIADVNNEENGAFITRIFEKEITTVTRVPMKRVFGEEATGTWCGWCPRGAVFMDSMALKYPDTWIGVAVHNGDPMVVSTYDNGIGGYIGGYPSGLVDRVGEFDPSQFEAAYMSQLEVIAPVDVEIVDLAYDETTREILFDVQGTFVTDLNVDLRFNAIIIENNVTGTDGGYNQANYYSGGDYGEMGGYEALPNPVSALNMEYQFVARAILGGWSGTANSIPGTLTADQVVSHSYSYTLPEDYDHTHIKVIGLVIDQSNDAVLNAVQVSLGYDDVAEITSIENVSIFPNPAIDIINVEFEVNQTQVVALRLFDLMGKEVARKHFENVHTGLYRTQMNVKDLNQGMYILQIDLGHESVTKKVNVVK